MANLRCNHKLNNMFPLLLLQLPFFLGCLDHLLYLVFKILFIFFGKFIYFFLLNKEIITTNVGVAETLFELIGLLLYKIFTDFVIFRFLNFILFLFLQFLLFEIINCFLFYFVYFLFGCLSLLLELYPILLLLQLPTILLLLPLLLPILPNRYLPPPITRGLYQLLYM